MNALMHGTALFGLMLSGPLAGGCASRDSGEPVFDRHEVVIGSATRQVVLTGFLLGGPVADLAVVRIDERGDRRLRIYAFGDGGWEPAVDATLRPETSFIDVGRIDGHDRLIAYGDGRLSWFDPDTAADRPLVETTSDFDPPPRGVIPHVDITRDLNDDDRDDLVVPEGGGFRVFVQRPDGTFAEPVRIGPATDGRRIYGADGYRYDPWAAGRVHEMDDDRDGRGDLAYWNEDHFAVHHQDERGLFPAAATSFTADVTFDSDDIASLAVPDEVRHRRRDHGLSGDVKGRVLHTLDDLNGDGVADLGVFVLRGGSREPFGDVSALWSMSSVYEVHAGAPAPDGRGTVFAPDVGAELRSKGIPAGIEQHDFDGDGQVDMMYTIINMGIFEIIGAMMTKRTTLDLEFYRMEGGVYPDRPTTTRQIRAAFPPGEAGGPAAFYPAVLVGDVSGDGRSELLVQHGRNELHVFDGAPGPELFARRPRKVAVAMPRDEEYTWLVDLDRDGKQDVLMHHPSATEPQRVTVLIAR